MVLSSDGKTSAILLNLKDDERVNSLLIERSRLRDKQFEHGLSESEAAELERVSAEYDLARAVFDDIRHRDIAAYPRDPRALPRRRNAPPWRGADDLR